MQTNTNLINASLAQKMFNARKAMVASEIKKNIRGAHNRYADLSSVLDVVNPALESHNLLLLQPAVPGSTPSAMAVQTTVVDVDSGEQFTFLTEVNSTKVDPQANGGCITYARRYALMSLFSLVADDDDAQSAMPSRSSGSAAPAAAVAVPPSRFSKPRTAASNLVN